MCTAICFKQGGVFFGRNLDLEGTSEERIAVVPRNFPLRFLKVPELRRHFAIIGTVRISEGCPLFNDAMNERGLFGAALNFPESAVYNEEKPGFENIASFELISWVLASCSNLEEVKKKLEHANILSTDFSKNLKKTPLHWFFADKTGAISVEPLEKGLVVSENSTKVLTNEPPFEYHEQNLRGYLGISAEETENCFSKKLELLPYSRGMGAIGLPGDFSSASRFIKAVFAAENAVCESEEDCIAGFFHILDSVSMVKGCVRLPEGKLERTVYSSCADGKNGIYYYKTYENNRISAVDMKKENLESDLLISYPMFAKQDILWLN